MDEEAANKNKEQLEIKEEAPQELSIEDVDDSKEREVKENKDDIIQNVEVVMKKKEIIEEACKVELEDGDKLECVCCEEAVIEVVDEGTIDEICFLDLEANTTSNLGDYIKILENDILPTIGQIVESVEEQDKSIDKEADSMEADIQTQCMEIASHMEKAREEMTEKIQEDKTKRQEFLAGKKSELEEMQKSSLELLDLCKEYMMKGGQLMMDFFFTKCPSLSNMKAQLRPVSTTTVFEKGIIDIPAVRKAIGSLKLHSEKGFSHPLKTVLYTIPRPEVVDVLPTIVGGFATKMPVGDIWVMNDNEAWITNEKNAIITKYNSNGEALKMIDSVGNNESFVLDKDENFLVCSFWENRIIKITTDGDISTLIGNLPSSPTCIILNHEDDLVICMKGYPYLCIYSADGKLKKTELSVRDPSNINGGPYDVNPYRVMQNVFGEYIVVDSIWPFTVTSIDKNGKFKWKFQIDQEEVGYPYNICVKGTNEFIIADIEYQRFHVLTIDGQLIRSIAFKNLGMEDAWAMSRDSKGRLWTGQDNGNIRILELNY